MNNISNINESLDEVLCRIQRAKDINHRVDNIELLAVSKGVAIEAINTLYNRGIRNFGENYIQEWLNKKKLLATDISWHVIGHVQRNKSKWVAAEADWLHSLDSINLAQRLDSQRPSHLPALQICIEVNVSGSAQKSGVSINEIAPLAEYILSLKNLQLRGLMCIPSTACLSQLEKEMQQMQLLFNQLKKVIHTVDTLSMGMSSDLELAIAHGATMVRIGRALFGSRNE